MFRRATQKDDSDPPRRRRWGYRALMGVGVLLVASAVTWQVRATLWTTHSNRVGAVAHPETREGPGQSRPTPPKGRPSPAPPRPAPVGPQGLLVIPAIGLTAPVEEGTDDAQLNVAVGHVPISVWPGTTGNTVLEAHDVSYFVNIDQLKPGDTIEYQTACTTYDYTVQSHQVIQQGATVYNTPSPTISAWSPAGPPTPSGSPPPATWSPPPGPAPPRPSAPPRGPAGLGPGLGLPSHRPGAGRPGDRGPHPGHQLHPHGHHVGGRHSRPPPTSRAPAPWPSRARPSSPSSAPSRPSTRTNSAWWSDLAPGVPVPQPLVRRPRLGYDASLDVTVTAAGHGRHLASS